MMSRLDDTIKAIPDLDAEAMRSARERQDQLTKPQGALGMLEEISVKIAGITGDPLPQPGRKAVIVMAADHGVTSEGVSLYPSEVTAQMVINFLEGGAAINVLSRYAGASVKVVDIGVKTPLEMAGLVSRRVMPGTANMAEGPAMTRDEAVAAIEAGIEVAMEEIESGGEYFALGEMGIGNSTAASAVTSAVIGLDPREVTGRGTGIDDDVLQNKVEVIRRAIALNQPDPGDPLDLLSKVGGLEIGGIAGAILACAAARRPILIDGFISAAGALVASELCGKAVDFMIASHLSEERGHAAILGRLGLHPIIHANMRLGEGTGAALAFALVDAALKLLSEMATFEEAGVSGPKGDQ